jgi:hypothetical protein
LFEHGGNTEPVRAYVTEQFSRVLANRICLQQYIFAREFRGAQGYRPGAQVAALKLAKYICVFIMHGTLKM